MSIFNPDSLSLTGVLFEVIGALFLAIESFGLNRVKKSLSGIEKFSNWATSKISNMFIISLPVVVLGALGLFYESKFTIALFLPIIILAFLSTILIDHPDDVKTWTLKKNRKKQFSPIGFILLLIGNVLQVISYLWKM